MASRSRPPRLRLVPATVAVVLAAVLATQLAGLVIARSPGVAAPAASRAAAAADSVIGSGPRASDHASALAAGFRAGRAVASGAAPIADAQVRIGTEPKAATKARPPVPRSKPAAPRQATPKVSGAPKAPKTTVASFHGRNHVWIPSLGVSKSIQSFPCSRSRPPDAGVYRWGCAGSNNVYLLSHAWSTFKPLHDAYVAGRLRKGMQVAYADGTGTVRTYRIAWWRVVRPTTAASWAWAPQARSSMTLQTCVGANSEYRLMVRLIETG
jgi:hypothetical protein